MSQTMKQTEFIDAIEKLVAKWQPEDEQAGATHRTALAAIYAEMREQMAHDLAEAMRRRDEAISQRLHRYYLGEVERIIKTTGKPRRGRPPKL